MWRCSPPSRRPRASTPAATRAAGPTATACSHRRARSVFTRGSALWWPQPIDREALDACAAALRGRARLHRVHAHRDRSRALRARRLAGRVARARATCFEFWIEADTFMRHMNRVLVGTMLEVALASHGGGVRAPAGRPAPPRGGPHRAGARPGAGVGRLRATFRRLPPVVWVTIADAAWAGAAADHGEATARPPMLGGACSTCC